MMPFDVLRTSVYDEIHETYKWHSWNGRPLKKKFLNGLARSIGLSIEDKADILERYSMMAQSELVAMETVFAHEKAENDAVWSSNAKGQEMNRRIVRTMREWVDLSMRFCQPQ